VTDIASIRQQYPQYGDMTDADLAKALHQKYYSDMPEDQFNQKIGFKPDSTLKTVGKEILGAGEAALTVASGVAQQAVGTPKDVARLAEKATEPLSRMTPELKAKAAELESKPDLTSKLQDLLKYEPKTPEGKKILKQLGGLLSPVAEVGGAIRQQVEKLPAGKEIANVGSDIINLSAGSGAVKASKAAAALKAAESTESKVQRIIGNLGGGKSLEKADVGTAAGKAISKTVGEAKAKGTAAYDELTQIMGPNTNVPLSESSKAAARYGTGIAVDPTVKAFSSKIEPLGSATFESLKDLRTQISDAMGTDRNVNRKLRALRDGLTADIEARATKLDPEAKSAWDKANASWKAYVEREDSINKILGKNWQGKTGTEVYNKLIQSAVNDPKKITTLMENIKDPAAQKQFAASVLHHMSDRGGRFDGDKLVAQWDRMNPQARRALFGPIGGSYEANMTKLVQNLRRIKEGHSGLIRELGGVGVASVLAHFIPGGTAAVGAVTLGREAYKFGPKAVEAYLTSPKWVRKLAEGTTAALEHGTGAAVVGAQKTREPTVGDIP